MRKAKICNEVVVFHFYKKVREITTITSKNICDNRKFWKVVKPLLSNKIVSNEKITLVV